MNDTRTLVPVYTGKRSSSVVPLVVLTGMFFLGSLLGCLSGRSVSVGSIGLDNLISDLSTFTSSWQSFLWFFFIAAYPCILCIFFSASLIGPIVLPFVFLANGFCVSAAFYVLLLMGITPLTSFFVTVSCALFATVALFLVGEESFCSAVALVDLCRGRPGAFYSSISFQRILFSCILLAASAALHLVLIPRLL